MGEQTDQKIADGAYPFERWLRKAWVPNKYPPNLDGPLDPEASWMKFKNVNAVDINFEELVAVSRGGTVELTDLCQRLRDRTPLFDRFCEDAFPGDDEAKRGLLLIISYCFLPDNPYQRYFFFEGIAGGGKGTFAELILDMVGRGHNGAKVDFDRMLSDAWLGPIKGKTVIVIDEAEGQDIRSYRKVMRELARVTGSPYASSRKLNEDARDVFVGQKFIVISNKQIDADDPTGQQERRVVPVYFGHKPSGEIIENLHRKMFVQESDWIATYALAVGLTMRKKWGSKMFDKIESPAFSSGRERFSESTAQLSRFLRRIVVRSEEGVNLASELLIAVVKVWAGSREGTEYLLKGIDRRVVSEMRAISPNGYREKLPAPGDPLGRRKGFLGYGIDCAALVEETDMTPREILCAIKEVAGKKTRIWSLVEAGLDFPAEDFDAAAGVWSGQTNLSYK